MTRHLIIIGAQRCGTTYLHSLLDAHPEIAMARPARPEPKVFLSDELAGRGRAWYESTYFAHAESQSLLGEKSTSYLEHPEAAARAAAVLGPAEIIVVLRDPVARAVSNWQFSTENGLEGRPLEDALRGNLDGTPAWDPVATSVSPFAYLERGRYATYLDPWFAQFPDTMHVRFFDELIGDDSEPTRLYKDLGVDPSFRPDDLGRPVNTSRDPAPDLDPGLVTEVRRYTADSDARLRRMLGRELPWPTS
ncbi:MAG: sulfotransferase domain-containing protein [Sporichthyaceae bacterium]|nr:sulfotransferase domain-containing protein [Sporichthyaceae bacterium]